ncbi:MAG: insulinase family protein [Candidatus Marinimicrobia bacterium]|nr:insulinase family protein [Candidatus Neomarinimicrobiota bacterium]MBL7023716.1 insulinase family protein [Candidatus Neomarinimicrobiota bacterium]MBL7109497.1 insulinase family protein [Candidatus Neomarinimicrobiota bacterium]
MKKKIIFIITSVLLIIGCYTQSETSKIQEQKSDYPQSNVLVKTLPNGMEIAVKENHDNTSVGFYCFVKTGSVNEGRYLGAGISHYLEHVVSGGTTTKRTEDDYAEAGKEIGAIVNAYTTQDVTAYHILTDKEYQDKALEMLSEQMQFCDFDTMEVAREKQVILKEIVMRMTPPRSKIYQRNLELVYPNSNKKYPVIGIPKLFSTITRDELKDYYYQRYAPNNMVFVAVGDFNAQEMLAKVEKAFKDFEREQLNPVYLPEQGIRSGEIEFVEEFEIQNPNVYITSILPSADYEDVTALQTALEILFSNRQSPIKYKLTEELKLVNYIYAYIDSNPGSPESVINIGFEAKDVTKLNEIIRIIDAELEKYSTSGIEQSAILNILNQKKAQKLLSTPSVDDDCNNIGWNMILYGIADTYEMNMKQLEEINPQDLYKAISNYLLPKNRVILFAVPIGSDDEIKQSNSVFTEKQSADKIQLDDNLTLIYKPNNQKPIITGGFYLPISSNYETSENVGTISFMTDLLLKGSQNYHPLDITEWIENHAVTLYNWADNDGTYFRFKCLKDDYPELQNMIIDAITNPSFLESEISLAKERKLARYQRSLSDAGSVHSEFRSSVLYPETREAVSREEKLNIITNLDRDDIIQIYKEYFNSEKAIFTYFGDLTNDEASNFAETVFSIIPKNEIDAVKTPLQVPNMNESFTNQYSFEQVNLNLNYPAPKLGDDDFFVMSVIETILKGSRGRIFKAVRGDNDLAYFAYPNYSYGDGFGFFRLTTQTSPENKDKLIAVLKDEIEKLKSQEVSLEEINLAIEEHQKILKTYMNDNQLPFYMMHYEAMGLGYDYITKSEEFLKKVTQEDILRVSNKYFNNAAIIVSEPSSEVDLMVD